MNDRQWPMSSGCWLGRRDRRCFQKKLNYHERFALLPVEIVSSELAPVEIVSSELALVDSEPSEPLVRFDKQVGNTPVARDGIGRRLRMKEAMKGTTLSMFLDEPSLISLLNFDFGYVK